MEETIRRLTKILGASQVEAAGHDVRFAVEDQSGAKLHVSLEGEAQRVMVTLIDPNGAVRCSLDMAPVSEAFEEPKFPGRVTLRIGNQLLHLENEPNLAIEFESIEPEYRNQSARMRAAEVEVEAE